MPRDTATVYHVRKGPASSRQCPAYGRGNRLDDSLRAAPSAEQYGEDVGKDHNGLECQRPEAQHGMVFSPFHHDIAPREGTVGLVKTSVAPLAKQGDHVPSLPKSFLQWRDGATEALLATAKGHSRLVRAMLRRGGSISSAPQETPLRSALRFKIHKEAPRLRNSDGMLKSFSSLLR